MCMLCAALKAGGAASLSAPEQLTRPAAAGTLAADRVAMRGLGTESGFGPDVLVTTRAQSTSGDQNIDSLLAFDQWDGFGGSAEGVLLLRYAFPNSAADYTYNIPGTAFSPIAEGWRPLIVEWFALYAEIINIEFEAAAPSDAVLNFGAVTDLQADGAAFAGLPSTFDQGGDVWFNAAAYQGEFAPQRGNTAFGIIGHEIGHALGLSHPFDDGTGPVISPEFLSVEHSIMAYKEFVGQNLQRPISKAFNDGPQTPMVFDIAALQHLYGANHRTRAGDTTYAFDAATGAMIIDGVAGATYSSGKIFRSVWDGDGVDTYDFSNFASGQLIDLTPGAWSTFAPDRISHRGTVDGIAHFAPGNIVNPLLADDDPRSLIEQAITGAGNDRIIGNQADNLLIGGAGNDSLLGAAGNDVLIGDLL